MRQSLLPLALLLLLSGCASSADLRPSPCEVVLINSSDQAVLPTRRCADYFLVETFINGRGPYLLLLDTGASQTVVSPRIARELAADLAPVATTAEGSQGKSQSVDGLLNIRTLRAGELELRGMNAIALDLAKIQAALGVPIDGILGYQAFSKVSLTIDYPASAVRISRAELPEDDNKRILSLTSYEKPNVEVVIGGKRRVMLLDSGKAGAFSLRNLNTQKFASPPADVSTGVSIGGSFVTRMARLAEDVTLGSLIFRQPVVDDSDASDLIGALAMKPFAVTFDQRSQRVRFDGPAEPIITFPSVRGVGLGFDYTDDGWLVSHVFPGSPAALAGVQIGDRLIRFNGKRLHELACTPPREMFASGDSIRLDFYRRPRQRITLDMPIAILVP